MGAPLRMDASAIHRSSPMATTMEPWFGPSGSGRGSIVASARVASKPSASRSACNAPFPAQQVPPVPYASHAAKKSSAGEPGGGPGRASATWITPSAGRRDRAPACPPPAGALALHRRHGVLRASEGHEERVAQRVDLVPVVLGERVAQNALVVGERLGVPLAPLLEHCHLPVHRHRGLAAAPAATASG
jgi:hypothetical protein